MTTADPSTVPPAQITLFAPVDTPDAFRKAVQALHSKPKAPLTLLQRKLGNAWLKNAIETPPDDDGWWELNIGEMARTIGFDSNNRQYLKESAEALMRIVFEWDVIAPVPRRIHWKASVLFPEIEIRSDVIRYQISSQMRERLVNPDMYAMIDMNIVRRFRRAPSLAIWEFCVRFEKISRTAEVPWAHFRDMILGESAEGKTYQEYKYFKSKVLLPAIAEINSESDHEIVLLESKEGRRISALRFEVHRKASAAAPAVDGRELELLGELTRLGLPQSEARRLLGQRGVPAVSSAVDYTRRRQADKKLAPLDNPAAYFRQSLEHAYGVNVNTGNAGEGPKPLPKPAKAAIDIHQAFEAQRVGQAQQYFTELDPIDQASLIERYNQNQATDGLKIKKKATKLSQAAFLRWLAQQTWGPVSPEELVEFAQKLLSERQKR